MWKAGAGLRDRGRGRGFWAPGSVALALLAGGVEAQFGPNLAKPNEDFGSAVAAGDFNGDGVADLAVGVPGEVVSRLTDAGAVHVFYGQSQRLLWPQNTGSVLWHQDSAGVADSAQAGDRFGSAVTSGDFDGDGYDDLAVSAPNEDLGFVGQAGVVHVLFGSPSGIGSARSQLWNQGMAGNGGTVEVGDFFGDALAAGDFDGDGLDDLAIGTPREDIGRVVQAGVVQVLYGAPVLGPTVVGAQLWFQGPGRLPESPENLDQLGSELAVGDFNADGLEDLALAAPFENLSSPSGTKSGAGVVHVVYGSSIGLIGQGQMFSPLDAGVPSTSLLANNYGTGLAAGDFNGDGRDDLAVGAPGGYTITRRIGQVYVLYSAGASGLNGSKVQTFTQDTNGIAGLGEDFDEFGAELASGDFDGDGVEDLAVGVPGEGIGSLSDAGAVNVIYGQVGLGLDAANDQLLHQNSSGVEGTSHAYDRFGEALVSADFDGDGLDDLAIGVPGDNPNSVTSAGAVNLFFSSGFYGLLAGDDALLHQFVWQITFGSGR